MARDAARIKRMLDLLRGIWERNPDQRLGQLICNASAAFERTPFYFEDEQLEEALRRCTFVNATPSSLIPPAHGPFTPKTHGLGHSGDD